MSARFLFGPILAILLVPAALLAQGRGKGLPGGIGFQWWDNPVANGLNLSEAQNKQIHSIVAEYRSRLIDLRANEEKAQGDFQDIFNDAPADQKRANDAIDRLSSARAEMTKTISQMSLKMRNVLTAEQWQQLRDRQEERRNRLKSPPLDSKGDPRTDGRKGYRRGTPPDGSAVPPPAPAPQTPAPQK